MLQKWNYTLLICLLLAFAGCSDEANKISIPVEPVEIRDGLEVKLANNNIWFNKKSDRIFEFYKKDIQLVIKYGEEISEGIIPTGRSISYGPEYAPIMKAELESASVPYEIIKFDGSEWFVWPEEHSGKVHAIQSTLPNKSLKERDALTRAP